MPGIYVNRFLLHPISHCYRYSTNHPCPSRHPLVRICAVACQQRYTPIHCSSTEPASEGQAFFQSLSLGVEDSQQHDQRGHQEFAGRGVSCGEELGRRCSRKQRDQARQGAVCVRSAGYAQAVAGARERRYSALVKLARCSSQNAPGLSVLAAQLLLLRSPHPTAEILVGIDERANPTVARRRDRI